jgi:uncharacterized protein YkwD
MTAVVLGCASLLAASGAQAATVRGGCRPLPARSTRAPVLGCRAGIRVIRPHSRRTPRRVVVVRAPSLVEPTAKSTIAKALATPCQNTGLVPEPGNIEQIDAAVLCLINRERAAHGELPLELNGQLQQAADSHTRDMLSADYFAHQSPDGQSPVDRVRASGYIPGRTVGYVIGENLAWGTLELSTPQAVVEAWIASPEHLANILEGQFRDTGIGVVPSVPSSLAEGQPGAVYTEEFGVIVH